MKKFRLQLARELIGEYTSRRRAGRGGGVIRPLPLQHFPLKVVKGPCEPERKRRRLFSEQTTCSNVVVLSGM